MYKNTCLIPPFAMIFSCEIFSSATSSWQILLFSLNEMSLCSFLWQVQYDFAFCIFAILGFGKCSDAYIKRMNIKMMTILIKPDIWIIISWSKAWKFVLKSTIHPWGWITYLLFSTASGFSIWLLIKVMLFTESLGDQLASVLM